MSLRNINPEEKTNRMTSLKNIQKMGYEYKKSDFVNYKENNENNNQNIKMTMRGSKSLDPFKIYSKVGNQQNFNRIENHNFNSQIPNDNIFDSILKASQFGKRKFDLKNDLNNKFNEEIQINSQLNNEINKINIKLEEEKRRLENLVCICKEDLKEVKIREEEKISDFEKIKFNDEELNEKIFYGENLRNELACDLEKIENDNKMLKTELKRIGELTADKLLDLENNINSIGRMRDFEKENFEMEREKIHNSSEFVIEQMKTHFDERSNQIMNNLKQVSSDKKKSENQLQVMTSELKNFNNNADHKIRNLMSNHIHEEETKQNKEIKEHEHNIKLVENDLNSLQTENRNLIENFQNLERECKNNLINKRNINSRFKEELSYLENNYNKIFVTLNSENKGISQKQFRLQKLEEELVEIVQKQKTLQENYDEEFENIEADQELCLNNLNNEFEDFLKNEKELLNEIEMKKEHLIKLENNHNQIIENIQKKLNNTLEP